MSIRTIGLIAGSSQFPILIARAARKQGLRVVAVAHYGETLTELEKEVDEITWIYLGQLKKLITTLKKGKVEQTVMCGGVLKTRMFYDVKPDLKALALLKKIRYMADDGILRALAQLLNDEGIAILPSQELLPELLAIPGTYTNRCLTRDELASAKLGWLTAGELGRLDIGQSVVIKGRVIIAIEAIEGTDACIHRGGELAGAGAIVVKRCKPFQDRRFDLPAIGVNTIEAMISSNCSALIIEAYRTLVFDRKEMVQLANNTKISITAWKQEEGFI